MDQINIVYELNQVYINLDETQCKVNNKRSRPNFLAYGWKINPWKNDLCAPMYGANEFR